MRPFEVKPDPTPAEIMRFGHRPVPQNQPGIADRDRVVLPVPGKLLDSGDHPLGGHRRARRETSEFLLSGGENLDVGSAYIDTSTFMKPCLITYR